MYEYKVTSIRVVYCKEYTVQCTAIQERIIVLNKYGQKELLQHCPVASREMEQCSHHDILMPPRTTSQLWKLLRFTIKLSKYFLKEYF